MGTQIFIPVEEQEVSRAIINEFLRQLDESIACDYIIVGSGPAGLMASWDLASRGKKVLIIEKNNYLGGGLWAGGYLMNKLTVRAPAHQILDEIGVCYKEYSSGLFVADAPDVCAKLISAAYNAGVKVLNFTAVEDVVVREGNRVTGVVINWTAVNYLPKAISGVDPIALKCKAVIDATGREAVVVVKLEERGLIKRKGYGPMWIEQSEDLVIKHTGKVYEGLYVAGMAVSAFYGLPSMGPTFGSMLLSGRRVAEILMEDAG